MPEPQKQDNVHNHPGGRRHAANISADMSQIVPVIIT